MPEATSPLAGGTTGTTAAAATTAAASTTAASTTAATSAAGNGAAPEWGKELKPETLTILTKKGWDKAPNALDALSQSIAGYANLEKMVTAGPVDQLIRLPGKDADEATRAAFFAKIGVPEKAEDYKIPDALKNDPIAQAFREPARKFGIPADTFSAIVGWVAEQGDVLAKNNDTTFAGECTKIDGELRGAWGQAYERNVQAELAAQKHIGLTDDEVVALARTSGVKSVRERLSRIGLPLLEAQYHDGQGGAKSGALRGLTPGEAKERLQSLQRDPDWARRIKANDPIALKEKRALIAMEGGTDPDEAESEWQRMNART